MHLLAVSEGHEARLHTEQQAIRQINSVAAMLL